MSKPLFQVRNRFREVEHSLSEKEILARIASGRYSGDEEVASEPLGEWHRLSAHPNFYDAFLNKLFEGQYQAPHKEGSYQAPKEASRVFEPLTKHQDAVNKDDDDEDAPDAANAGSEEADGRTTKLPTLGTKGHGGTIGQAAIDELFSDVSAKAKEKTKNEPPEEDLLSSPLSDDGTAVQPIEPLPITPPSEPAAEEVPPSRRNKKRWIIIGATLLLLVILFQLGQSPSKKPIAENESQTTMVRQLISDPAQKDEKVRTLVEEGEALMENDTPSFYLGAQELFLEALSYDEKNIAAIARLCETTARLLPDAFERDGLEKQIAEWLKKGRSLDPQFSPFYRTEALVAMHKGKLEEAKAAITHAMETDPGSSDNSLVLAELLYLSGDISAAYNLFREILKVHPGNIRPRYFQARVALDRKESSEAQELAIETIRRNPIHANSYLLLARMASDQSRYKEARQLYDTAGKLARFAPRREMGKGYYRLGVLHETNKEKLAANTAFQLAYYYAPEMNETLKEKIRGLDTSDAVLKQLAATHEYNINYFEEQGESLYRQEKLKESRIFYQAAYLLNPGSGKALLKLGEVTEKLAKTRDDFRSVINFYQRAIEKEPTLVAAYIKLGLLEADQYNIERALKLLQQASALAPNSAEPFVALGKLYYKTKDYINAVDEIKKAFKIKPSDSEILYYAGLLKLLGGKEADKDAASFFYRAYLINPSNHDALAEWLKIKTVNYEKSFAVRFIKNLIQQDPKDPWLRWILGEIYAANREHRRAVEHFRAALDINNRLAKVRMSLAKSLEAIGEFETAAAEYHVASQLDRRNSDGAFRAAELHIEMKNLPAAEVTLAELVMNTPNYPGVHQYLSRIYRIKNQKDKAISEMKLEIANNPRSTSFRLELSELYMEYQKYEEAIEELNEITNLPHPDEKPQFAKDKIRGYLLLSRCFRATKQAESAEGAIRLALDIDPQDPELHKELGFVFASLQRPREAIREFSFYLGRNPTSRDADEVRKVMRGLGSEE